MNEPTLQELKAQLDRIERMLASSFTIPVNQPMDDSNLAVLTGGIPALRELNKRRAAEQRRKKK
jgi:hypothetical protein